MCTPSSLFRCGDRVSLCSSLLGSDVYGDGEDCVCTLNEEYQFCPDFFLDALTLYLTSCISDPYSNNKNGAEPERIKTGNKKVKRGRGTKCSLLSSVWLRFTDSQVVLWTTLVSCCVGELLEFSPKVKTVKDQSVWYMPALTDWPLVGCVFSVNPPCSL